MNSIKFWAMLSLIMMSMTLNAATDSVAMLTGLTGSLSANGKPVTLFSELKVNTQLTLSDQAKATIVLFSKGQEFILQGPLNLQIRADTIETNGQPLAGKTLLSGSANLKLAVQDFEQAATVMRGSLDSVELVYPLHGRIPEQYPVFKWVAPGSGYQYQFELLNQQGGSIYTTKTHKPELKLPETVTLPQEQPITWTIEATKGTEILSNQAIFMVASQPLVDQLNQQKPIRKPVHRLSLYIRNYSKN